MTLSIGKEVAAQKRGWHNCPSKSIPAGEIEQFVMDQIRRRGCDFAWDRLTPGERERIVPLLVERVDYDGATSKVAITFHPSGFKTLTDESAGRNTEDAA